MNVFRRLWLRRRLARTMKPDPTYRERRLAQFTPERREKYRRNVEFLSSE